MKQLILKIIALIWIKLIPFESVKLSVVILTNFHQCYENKADTFLFGSLLF